MAVKFQQRHYEWLAETVRELVRLTSEQEIRWIAHELADRLERDNARFDRSRFLKACGVSEEA